MTEGYTVQVSSEAVRGLGRLPAKVAAAIVQFVTVSLMEDPQRLSKPLRGDLEAYRSARRGDYRVFIRIDEDARVILVVCVDHRAHAYRPL